MPGTMIANPRGYNIPSCFHFPTAMTAMRAKGRIETYPLQENSFFRVQSFLRIDTYEVPYQFFAPSIDAKD
jgi:hypothetical protein